MIGSEWSIWWSGGVLEILFLMRVNGYYTNELVRKFHGFFTVKD